MILSFFFISLLQFTLAFPLLSSLFSTTHTVLEPTFQSCGNESDIFQFTSLTLSPDPPEAGAPLKIEVKGYLSSSIAQGSTAEIKVKIGLIKLIDQTYDLCNELPQINMTCPIQPGEQDIVQTVDIPSLVPKGKYQVNVRLWNQDKLPIACVFGSWIFS